MDEPLHWIFLIPSVYRTAKHGTVVCSTQYRSPPTHCMCLLWYTRLHCTAQCYTVRMLQITIQYWAELHNTAQCCTDMHNAIQYTAAMRNIAQHYVALHKKDTALCSTRTELHSFAQYIVWDLVTRSKRRSVTDIKVRYFSNSQPMWMMSSNLHTRHSYSSKWIVSFHSHQCLLTEV